MAFVRCSGELFPSDAFFCFTITIRRPALNVPHYTEYQYFLYETLSVLREKVMTFNQIVDHSNTKVLKQLERKYSEVLIAFHT